MTLAPPAPEWLGRLEALYRLWDRAHASGRWMQDMSVRLRSPLAGALDRFHVAPFRSQVAAALDVSRSVTFGGIGVVHRVFTHPTMRRKGLAAGLLEAAKQEFRSSGGRLLILAAPERGSAPQFYAAQGFSEIVRAEDGEVLLGWAARGRHVREAALRLLKHEPVRWRPATPGDWAGLVLWSSVPGGAPGGRPKTLLDVEWIDLLGHVGGCPAGQDGARFALEVGESRHGYIVGARGTGSAPAWLAPRLAG